jgi:hypothetical protein
MFFEEKNHNKGFSVQYVDAVVIAVVIAVACFTSFLFKQQQQQQHRSVDQSIDRQ